MHACNCNQNLLFVCWVLWGRYLFKSVEEFMLCCIIPMLLTCGTWKDVSVSAFCLRILPQRRRCCFAARLQIPCWQILVLLKKGPLIGTHLHFKNVLCTTWTTQWTHICWWLLVSDSRYVVNTGLHVFVCCHIRTCYPLALCHFFMSLDTHLMGLLAYLEGQNVLFSVCFCNYIMIRHTRITHQSVRQWKQECTNSLT